MASTLKHEAVAEAAKATAKATDKLQSELSAPPKPKAFEPVEKKPFVFSRRGLINEAEQVRRHFVLNVPAGVEYARVLEAEAYRSIAGELRQGDLVELRFEPNLADWALLLVVALRPTGAEVRELVHRHFDDVAPAASIEELAGLRAEQVGLNSWAIIRESDQHQLPGEYPTAAAARAEIAKMGSTWAGRGWAKNS